MRDDVIGLRIIGTLKLVTALLLCIVGFGILRLMDRDIAEDLKQLTAMLRIDPKNHLIYHALSRLTGISPHRLRELEAGTFLYAILHSIEGVGLLYRRHWAEYLTIIVTSSFMPFEIYELAQGADFIRAAALLINAAVVVYLVYALRRDQRGRRPGE